MRKVFVRWHSLLLGAALVLGIPKAVSAQTVLTWAKLESLRNRVHLIPSNQNARLARVNDFMGIDDALQTALSSRAELRFNDGSLARVGEQAIFRFTPNTRNFQLSNGTVLLLIPPSRGRTTIQTPNAVTGIQGSALFVRVRCLAELTSESHCSRPVTLVGALTNNSAGPMVTYNQSGTQQQPIYAGEMVVIESGAITQRHQFDLKTFYETSGLVEGLQLDSTTPPANMPSELQEVWQEIQDALELQRNFDSQHSAEDVVENPVFLSPILGANTVTASSDENIFAEFPAFATSPAAAFHGMSFPIASTTPSDNVISDTGIPDTQINVNNTAITSTPVIDPVNSAPATEIGIGPAAIISTPSSAAPAVTAPPVSAVVTPPTAVAPVISEPAPVPGPTVVSTTPTPVTPVAPPVLVPTTPVVVEQPSTPAVTASPTIPEAATGIPGREAVGAEEFNWQQPSGANDPDALLQTPNLSINEAN